MERDPAAALPQVICLGEALVDRLGPPGGDPATAPPEQLDDRLGGAPANVACGLARLGTPVAFVGRLGRDAIGEAFARLLAERGVNLSALQWDGERPTRIVLVRRSATGERRFEGFAGEALVAGQGGGGGAVFADQALAARELELALPPLLAGARWLQIGSIPLASAASAQALEQALTLAQGSGVAVALDVNWRPTFWDAAADPDAAPGLATRARLQPLLERARLLKLAAEEAEGLFGSRDPAAIAASLPQRPAVVVTDGAAGVAWWFGGDGSESVDAGLAALPAFQVPVVDSTGAGDAFLAGLLHCLCAEPALLADAPPGRQQAAIRFACACGALVCQGSGAIDPQPRAAAVEAFLAAHP
jgi:fructokinase